MSNNSSNDHVSKDEANYFKAVDLDNLNSMHSPLQKFLKSSKKCLGLNLDDKLTWQKHVNVIKSKLVKCIGIFSQVRFLMPGGCLAALYYAFIHSRLNYRVALYIRTTEKVLRSLITIQNRVLRVLQFRHKLTPSGNLIQRFFRSKIRKICKYITFAT